jgi:Calcium binding
MHTFTPGTPFMARTPEQADREQRIDYEAVVDAYDEVERAMGWYCYLQDRLKMPFDAICKSNRASSALTLGEEVQVLSMADEDDCMAEVFVLVKHGKTELAVPLAQLECHAKDKDTCEAVADWHYWVARGYQY